MSTSLSTQERDTEHEVLTYLRVAGSINNIVRDAGKLDIKMDTPLTKALDALSSIPSVQRSVSIYKEEENVITIGGVNAGTLSQPKVNVILEKSTPSSFGRGSETVLDPAYRSGREIPAADIGLTGDVQDQVLYTVRSVMFPGREVKAKLYKLAVYEGGGHFDWHMDSTHSDQHHATLLVALKTSWEGGNLILRRNGVETSVDLHPKVSSAAVDDDEVEDYENDDDSDDDDDDYNSLKTVAFFTDTEHRVEPVTAGIRIVLQYDIEVAKKEEKGEKREDKDKDEEEEEEEEEDLDDDHESWLDNFSSHYSKRIKSQGVAQATADKAALGKVIDIVKKLHSNGTNEVAFALQHLYRKTSILPEYLKGPDAVAYDALLASGNFDISLHPVILQEKGGYDGEMEGRYAIVYPTGKVDTGSDSPPQSKRRKLSKSKPALFHIPKLSAIQQISRQEYIEHTGNEAMPADYRYFGGGMFVRPKAQ